jgi:hypothetical protein
MTFLRQLAGNHRAAESGTDAKEGGHGGSFKFQVGSFKRREKMIYRQDTKVAKERRGREELEVIGKGGHGRLLPHSQ